MPDLSASAPEPGRVEGNHPARQDSRRRSPRDGKRLWGGVGLILVLGLVTALIWRKQEDRRVLRGIPVRSAPLATGVLPPVENANADPVALPDPGALPDLLGLSDPAASPPTPPDPPSSRFAFSRENVLGTSFRLELATSTASSAERALRAVLEEIESQRMVFSTYDFDSELGKINALPLDSRREVQISRSLALVLRSSLRLEKSSHGAFDPYLGSLIDLWHRAVGEGKTPSEAALSACIAGRPGFEVRKRKRGRRSVYLLSCQQPGRFELSGIAKGYIMDRALHSIQEMVQGALLDIGGDIVVSGGPGGDRGAGWPIDIADPKRPAENDLPLDRVMLKHMAIATSGSYARPMVVAGQPHSHILDPRTGHPADEVLGATVIAPDAATADSLATAVCVLGPEEGIALVDRQPVAACLLMDREGHVYRSRDWLRFRAAPSRAEGIAWPEGYALDIHFELIDSGRKQPAGRRRRRFKRHGTAVWIEDARGRRVRLLTLWFDRKEMSHVRKLSTFWREGWVLSGSGADYDGLRAVSRASRRPGQYSVVWDGRDDAGQRVPRGRYRVRIDINREHGPGPERDTAATLEISCGEDPAHAEALDQPELASVRVDYGPR